MPIKIAILGAGSIGFTRRLVQDILAVPELVDTTFALMDISKENLDRVTQLVKRDIRGNHLPAKVLSTLQRRKAIEGADYILCLIRQGGLKAFHSDIEIPLQYGVDQCVGDTLCAGGLMYAQRTIPVLLDICADIKAVAKPGALFLNYANPMAMNTWACNLHGGVKTVGLCHGVQGAHWQIARVIELWAQREGLIGKEEKIHRKDVDVIAAGLNHQTWFLQAKWRGRDFVPMLGELFPLHEDYARTEKVRIDVLHRFGYYSTESNGHLSEYLPWYRKRRGEIKKWIDLSSWIHGETGGYLRVCEEGRNWFDADYPQWLTEPVPEIALEKRSEEHASYIIEALVTGRTYRGHFNVMNNGILSNLPQGCVIEVPGYVDGNGMHIPVLGDLPLACAATCSASAWVQKMGMEAAVKGDVTLLKQAMLHDPLCAAVCNPEEIWQMTDEMLVAQAEWLPQYKAHIPAARKRLEAQVANGTRVKLLKTQGAARLRTRSVQEMKKNVKAARANAQAADKGKVTKG